eukprot:1886437-Rhodomonas_salina.1
MVHPLQRTHPCWPTHSRVARSRRRRDCDHGCRDGVRGKQPTVCARVHDVSQARQRRPRCGHARATQSPVLSYRLCYAKSATVLPHIYAISGTVLPYVLRDVRHNPSAARSDYARAVRCPGLTYSVSERVCDAMSGTDRAHGAQPTASTRRIQGRASPRT